MTYELQEDPTYTPFYQFTVSDLLAKQRVGLAPHARNFLQQYLSTVGTNNTYAADTSDVDPSSLTLLLQLELAGLNALGEDQLIQVMQRLAMGDALRDAVLKLSAHSDFSPSTLSELLQLELAGLNGLGEGRLIQIIQQLAVGGSIREGVLNLSNRMKP